MFLPYIYIYIYIEIPIAALGIINIPKIDPYFLCKVFSLRTNIPHVDPAQNIRIVQEHFTFFFSFKNIFEKVDL